MICGTPRVYKQKEKIMTNNSSIELQLKIKKILNEINISTIIVSHDSYEAFYMGNKCGIILDQSLKQFDIPYNI